MTFNYKIERTIKPSEVYSDRVTQAAIKSLLDTWVITDFRPPMNRELFINFVGQIQHSASDQPFGSNQPRYIVTKFLPQQEFQTIWE